MRRDCMKTWKDAVESVWNGQKMGRKDKDEREEGSRRRGVDERHRQQQHWGLHSTSCWHCWTEKQITHLIFALILVPVSSSQLVPPAYWDTWHVDHPLLYSPLLSHTSYLSTFLMSPFLLQSGSVVSPSPVYVTAPLLVETKNAPQCVDKPSFKEIELYGDKRCPWAWVQITDWSDTADSLCFVN